MKTRRALVDLRPEWLHGGGDGILPHERRARGRDRPVKVKVLTWFWTQEPPRLGFGVNHVNTWAARMRERLPAGVGLAVVTDAAGVDRSRIEVIPPPREFVDVRTRLWPERVGAPQCYRRLAILGPRAAEIFGAEWLIAMDLDAVVGQRADALEYFTAVTDETPELTLHRATISRAHYNGGLLRVRAGARADIYARFAADPDGIAAASSRRYAGSDQAVLSYLLGPGNVPTFGEPDGVYSFSLAFLRADRTRASRPPENTRLVLFPGNVKPWSREAAMTPWVPALWAGEPVPPPSARRRPSPNSATGSPRQVQR